MINIISANQYVKSTNDVSSVQRLREIFSNSIESDGVRNRAYLKLEWDRALDKVSVAANQTYFQNPEANVMDGGVAREFAMVDARVLDVPIMQTLIETNLETIRTFKALEHHTKLVFGIHFVQYTTEQYGASYSSPDSLHVDDEPLVFVHLLNLTENAWGGDNIIADIKTKEITNVVRLEKPFETLVLTRNYYHAVTPLGSREGKAQREIILFTVEPEHTQVEASA